MIHHHKLVKTVPMADLELEMRDGAFCFTLDMLDGREKVSVVMTPEIMYGLFKGIEELEPDDIDAPAPVKSFQETAICRSCGNTGWSPISQKLCVCVMQKECRSG